MKLSLKVEYACQVLAQLGHHFGQMPLPHIEELAQVEAVPSNYLVQILNELRTGGLIVSKRGKQGGYALVREPKEISIYDVVIAMEGCLLDIPPVGKGASAARTDAVWQSIAAELEKKTREFSIRALMSSEGEEMWYI
jgi:Rrf2 family protein|tara:strand:+ start:2310 stop:2723 length:414 start_codon:yes stop_codon:yes gene_type:complete